MSSRRGKPSASNAPKPSSDTNKIDVRPFVHPKPTLNPWILLVLDIIGIPLVPIRLVAMLLLHVFYWSIVKIATLGLTPSDLEQPLPSWRRAVVSLTGQLMGRLGFLVMGFWVIEEQGTPDPRAKTIVSNHITFLDVLYFMKVLVPSFVAKEGTKKVPFIGYLSQAWNSVYAPSALELQRDAPENSEKVLDQVKKSTTDLIVERQKSPKPYPPLVIFPEGTTTNGQYLIAFKSGAFVAGEPVQPVVLKYPFDFFAPSWETILIRSYLWKLWSGLRFRIQAQWLPLYVPNEQEKANPALYASNVRAYMSKMSGIPLSESGIAQKAAYHKAIMGGQIRIDEQIEYL
eukprot:TRINITY_DN10689_c0_g1_i1.p1 TRINITY_DN10689_c0_g1~~TRINITY_DN10689_c0_g1_i1.p1  ORF type:complete len:344 (+),score=35.74 TRINITY_DN10689_c0_g1_i1:37-1068(+)